jgi:hypothetical protein
MSITVGIFLFDGVDELDFVGPLNVFSYASGWGRNGTVLTIGRHACSMQGVNGLRFEANSSTVYRTKDCSPAVVRVRCW